MTLKRSFVVYLIAVHLLFIPVAAILLYRYPLWLLALELAFVVSIAWGLALSRKFFGALDVGVAGAQLLNEGDFQSRLRETGREETDALIRVYNRMVDHLRDERTRLQEQQHLLAKILEVSPSGIAILDFDGRLSFVNARGAQLLSATADDLVGRELVAVQSPLADAFAAMQAGESQIVALWGGRRVRCHRGSFIDRGFERSFVLMEELTEELRQHEKAAYEKVIRMLSHEVNNSMGAAQSLLQSCLNYAPQLKDGDRADFETALRVVLTRTQGLSTFMRSFAEVVRLPAPRLQPQEVRPLLESVAILLGPASEERGVRWRWEVEDDLPPIALDRAQMEQVFMNVCKNALEAIGRDGVLTVRLGRRGGRQFATIEDTGAGIPDEVRQHLFTPFFSTKENGQGVGLMLAQEILRQHRFEFSLDSRSGESTRFTVVFLD